MHIIKKSVLALFLVAVAAVSCKRQPSEDLSLDAESYKKLGMPDYNRVWTNKEYSDANITLSGLTIDYPLSLPRKNSKRSGVLFNRFISEDNLLFADDGKLPLHMRAYRIQAFETLQRRMGQIYEVETGSEGYYNDELIDLQIYRICVHEKMLELACQIMNSKEEADINLQPGMQTVRNNFLKLMAGLLQEQQKEQEYDSRDLKKLSKKVAASLIKNNHWFTPGDRDSLITSINALIRESSSDYIRKNYSKALEHIIPDKIKI